MQKRAREWREREKLSQWIESEKQYGVLLEAAKTDTHAHIEVKGSILKTLGVRKKKERKEIKETYFF